jgi:hypothetical protein
MPHLVAWTVPVPPTPEPFTVEKAQPQERILAVDSALLERATDQAYLGPHNVCGVPPEVAGGQVVCQPRHHRRRGGPPPLWCPDDLLHLVWPRTCAANILRRGYTPELES